MRNLRDVVVPIALAGVMLSQFCANESAAETFGFTSAPPDAYLLMKGSVSFSSNATAHDIEELNQEMSGNYLWVRRAGNEMVIRDNNLINDAVRLFHPLEALESERDKIRDAQKQAELDQLALDQKEKALETKLEALAGGDKSKDDKRAELERQLTDLKSRRTVLEVHADGIAQSETVLASRQTALMMQIETALWSLVDRALLDGEGEALSKR